MKRKISAFFYVFKNSVSNPDYYKELADTKFVFSLKYLYALLYFMSFLLGIVIAIQMVSLIPKTPYFIQDVKSVMDNFYPDDLILTIEDGKLSTNFDTPYFIYLPSEIGDPSMRLITIDVGGSFEDVDRYKTVILVTESAIYYPSENGYEIFPLSEIDSMVIDRATYEILIEQINPYLDKIPFALYVGIFSMIFIAPFIIAIFSVSGKLFYLVFGAFILWLFAKIFGRNLNYKQTYKMSMHFVTLPIIYSYIVEYALGYHYPYIYTFIFLSFGGFIIYRVFSKTNS